MPKDPKIEQSERILFRREVADVQPLKHDKVVHSASLPSPAPRQPLPHADDAVERGFFSDGCGISGIGAEEELSFVRPGIQRSVLRKLRRGQYFINTELDLHGYTQIAACSELSEFLHSCFERNIRCVKIIHGKGYGSREGQPVLKRKVNSWLRQCDKVLAFSSARPEDGGTGALYVLLKNSNNQKQ